MQAVYAIRNILNGKVYIGSTNNLKKRIQNHRRSLRRHQHYSHYLQEEWNLYGENSFGVVVLEIVPDINLLRDREQAWIDKLRPFERDKGYNISPYAKYSTLGRTGVNAPAYGYRHSEEVKRRLSEINKGKKLTAEHKAKLSAAKKGTQHPKLRGEGNPSARLTSLEVKQIMQLAEAGITQASIAQQFNVAPQTISDIVNRKTWINIA